MSEAGTARGLGAGQPQIVVDDRDGGARPSQLESFVDKRVLATGRFGCCSRPAPVRIALWAPRRIPFFEEPLSTVTGVRILNV